MAECNDDAEETNAFVRLSSGKSQHLEVSELLYQRQWVSLLTTPLHAELKT
jgi:ABC-type uncharacterized transport system ATPase subunit